MSSPIAAWRLVTFSRGGRPGGAVRLVANSRGSSAVARATRAARGAGTSPGLGSDAGMVVPPGGCVEVAGTPDAAIAVRDSKDPDGPRLAFTADDWRAFLRQVKDGRPGPA